MKKFLLLILCATFFFSHNCLESSALVYEYYDGIAYLVEDGEIKICGCGTLTTNLVIPTVIYGKPVTKIGNSAFNSNSTLKTVKIPESVKTIGKYAFYNASNITGITIKSGVTEIGDHAFGCCPKLTELIIPDTVKSIGDESFSFSPCIEISYGGTKESWNKVLKDEEELKNVPILYKKIKGDSDANKKINVFDAVKILKIIAKITSDEADLSVVDINNDGYVDVCDVMKLLKYIARIDNTL